MKMLNIRSTFIEIAAVVLYMAFNSAQAMAHEGHGTELHDNALTSGLLHPLSGVDHWLALVLIGVWATRFASTLGVSLLLPSAFVFAMASGALVGGLGFTMPLLSADAALLVLLLGLAALTWLRAPYYAALSLVAVFGVLHGSAHGLGGEGQASPWFLTGLIFSSALLHLAGWALGHKLMTREWALGSLSVLTGIVSTALLVGN